MRIAIVGGGLTGMSAAYDLARAGHSVTLYERDDALGGLAGSFRVDGVLLEKFYHHMFTSDTAIAGVIDELGLSTDLEWHPTVTSLYYSGRIYRMSTPLDVLRFRPLSLISRLRLGWLAVLPRLVRDWKQLESVTSRDWLIRWAGRRGYEVVWEPLLRSKFGPYYDRVAAVWIWNKLKLRGGSRGKGQAENLGYLRGGFGWAVDALEGRLRYLGVDIRLSSPVERIEIKNGRAVGVVSKGELAQFERVLVTTAPQILLNLADGIPAPYRDQLGRIEYLANSCLVLKLNRSLSSTYWMNISDSEIPFVGLIEHTNMLRPEEYGGHHLVYLSRYMDAADPYYAMSANELFEAYFPHIRKVAPELQRDWVTGMYLWRERYTQPVVDLHYSERIPAFRTPIDGLWLCCMAQIYPEDRGMNYAVAYGRKVAAQMLAEAPEP